jgi:serpin B
VRSYSFDLAAALALMDQRGANVWLPRFENTSEIELLPCLGALGVRLDRADLSGFTGRRDLELSDVITKTWIRVDEEGTEAGSVTAIAFAGIGLEVSHPEFRVDHPFYFVLRDGGTGSVFFTGRIERPNPAP